MKHEPLYDPLTYWEERAPSWIQGDYPTEKMWERIQQYVKPEWRVIELGCGTGRWAQHFPHYTGVDISPTLLVHAAEQNPTKQFFHHDQRYPIPNNWDLIFTYTSWLHVPPRDMLQVTLPDTNYLFVEPFEPSQSLHCFTHNYEKLLGVKLLEHVDRLAIYGRFK